MFNYWPPTSHLLAIYWPPAGHLRRQGTGEESCLSQEDALIRQAGGRVRVGRGQGRSACVGAAQGHGDVGPQAAPEMSDVR